MREYGKVFTKFWSSDDIAALTEDERMLALYCLTCSHGNMLGLFRLPTAYVAEDLRWTQERASEALLGLSDKGFLYRCQSSAWTLINEYLKWNPFDNPNVGKAAGKLFKTIGAPKEFMALLLEAIKSHTKWFPEDISNGFETVSKPSKTPKSNHSQTVSKQGTGTVTGKGTVTGTVTGANPTVELPLDRVPGTEDRDPVQTIFAYWQDKMSSPTSKLDAKRKKLISKALELYTPYDICRAIRGCSLTPHNMGQNDRNTKYNGLNLILRDAEHIDHFIRCDEGSPTKGGKESVEEMNARIEREFLSDGGEGDNVIEMEQP